MSTSLDLMVIINKLKRDVVYVHIWERTRAFSKGRHLEWRIKIVALLKRVSD